MTTKQIELTNEQIELIKKISLNAIANGNTANPKSFVPTPNEYKMLHGIMNNLK